jgi:osmotically-inducible protein OsmY
MKYRLSTKRFAASVLAGFAVLASSAGMPSNSAASQGLPATDTVQAAQEQAESADQQLQLKVENALRSDPYFYDRHVDVLVEHGNVVLRGFVLSEWDLRDAIRIATKAAGGRRVIDDLTLELGGRR